MKFFIILGFLNINVLLYGQTISGTVLEKDSDIPIGYVNIGIVGKNIGTISDQNGRYTLQIPTQYSNDTLIFSSIGYHSFSIKVSDFLKLNIGNVCLVQRAYELTEIIVPPRRVRERKLGNTGNVLRSNIRTPTCTAWGFWQGSEMGIFMESNRTSFLKEVNWNIANFTYDSIIFRVNVYKPTEKIDTKFNRHTVYFPNTIFENILISPVYVTVTKEDVKNIISVDLRHLNIVLEGDFLVTFEYVKVSGNGEFIYHCIARIFTARNFYRRSRLSSRWDFEWGVGPSIWALVDVER